MSAHEWEPPGLNGAQLYLEDADFIFVGTVHAKGRNFAPNSVAQVFQCEAAITETGQDLRRACHPLTVASTDASGSFSTTLRPPPFSSEYATGAYVPWFVAPDGRTVTCRTVGPTQCAVAAATYPTTDPAAGPATAKAEHYFCFTTHPPFGKVRYLDNGTPNDPTDDPYVEPVPATPCADRPGTTTTTTTVPPPAWTSEPPMPTARQLLAATGGSDGRVYALGGRSSDTGQALATAEVFDPCRQSWSTLPPMGAARLGLGAAPGPDGRIYAIGGAGSDAASVEAYDPRTNRWEPVAPMSVPRASFDAVAGADGRIYAVGGDRANTAEAYDVATNTWQSVAPLVVPRSNQAAAALPDGRIFAMGAQLSYASLGRKVEIYAPLPAPADDSWAWQPGPEMTGGPQPVGGAAATGADGRIHYMGGNGTSASLAAGVNAYDPRSGAWSSEQSMLDARADHAAATAGGRIYAIGGRRARPALTPETTSSVESMGAPLRCAKALVDFGGDGSTDPSVFRPASGTWFAKDGPTQSWGADGDIPVPADYDGDGVTDAAIFRPSVGLWAIANSSGGETALTFGISTDVPVPADYDGDGRADIAIYRPEYGLWVMRHSSTGADVFSTFGISTDIAVPADYDGDGTADIAVYRDGSWFVQPSNGDAFISASWGAAGDVPVPGDYDADGAADTAIFRPSSALWAIQHSNGAPDDVFTFGISGDVPVVGDYDADGDADAALFRPAWGGWYTREGLTVTWGIETDIPLPIPPAVRMALAGAP